MNNMKNIWKNILIYIIFLLISCFVSYKYYRFPDWDFYSYHFFNGWAFLNNRFNYDVMPCAFRSFFNPILDALNYIAIYRLNNHPLILVLYSGIKWSVFVFIAYKIYDFVFKSDKNKFIPVIFCTILAGSSPMLLYALSFESTDIQPAILVLGGFYLFIKTIFNNSSKFRYYLIFMAMLLVGMAVGLKYVSVSFAIAFILSIICLYKKIENPKKTVFVMFLGLLIGFIITDGYWMYFLYSKFKNPVFPYFNNIFKSPYASTASSIFMIDFVHLRPKNILDFIFYPLKNSGVTQGIGFERTFFDLKISLSFISTIFIFVVMKNKNVAEKIKSTVDINVLYLLMYSSIFAYYINLVLFGQLRYILPLFAIIPVVIYLFIINISKNEYFYCSVLIGLLVYISTYQGYKGMGEEEWIYPSKLIYVEDLHLEDNATVICGNLTACFIAPTQNPKVRYVGFSLPKDLVEKGYWYMKMMFQNRYYTNDFLGWYVSRILAQNKNVYFIYSEEGLGENLIDLKLYQYALSRYSRGKVRLDSCNFVKYRIFDSLSSNDTIKICKIKD